MEHSVRDTICSAMEMALKEALGGDAAFDPSWIRRCNDPSFGDFQFNGALPLAKKLKAKPRDLAERVVSALDLGEVCEKPEIAGPGFINLRLTNHWLGKCLQEIPSSESTAQVDRLGMRPVSEPETVVVDMSSPNLAKEMHVGHLRSTVIGESVSRIMEFVGHTVKRVNHVGDWGTQFGMLLAHLRSTRPNALEDLDNLQIGDLEQFYVEAKRHFDADEAFADAARRTVVELQSGHPETLRIWNSFCRESLRHCHAVYDILGITKLIDRGESFYNDKLSDVVDDLAEMGMVQESDGAACVFLEGFTGEDGEPLPMIIRKSDGGFNYSTTDLAAARYRLQEDGATRLVYVVGAPQKHHFNMLFSAVRKAGWAGKGAALEHLAFGSMLGSDGKPFKTREGGTVKLKDLLAEAVSRARAVIISRVDEESDTVRFSEEQIELISRTVGISAVKYFDLSHSLNTDYKFEWDTMLALEGNTAPYMLYAYARIRSIGRKAGIRYEDLPANAPIVIEHECEVELAKVLLRFPELIEQISRELRPTALTEYLFEVSRSFSRFYDRKRGVRVIDAETDEIRVSRLRLCDITSRVIKTGLYLLGINTVEQM